MITGHCRQELHSETEDIDLLHAFLLVSPDFATRRDSHGRTKFDSMIMIMYDGHDLWPHCNVMMQMFRIGLRPGPNVPHVREWLTDKASLIDQGSQIEEFEQQVPCYTRLMESFVRYLPDPEDERLAHKVLDFLRAPPTWTASVKKFFGY